MRIGIDLGGTKTEAVLLDETGAEKLRIRRPTPRGDYDATCTQMRDMVEELEREAGWHAAVGIGMPGTISPATGLVKNANSTWLIGKPFQADMERLLGRALRFANDADCLAMSEATDGAGAGAGTVFAAILGTGVGGGVVVDGKLLDGPNGIAGEWGHSPLPWPTPDELPGPPCYCGKTGCIESWLSGPALAADHERATGQALPAEEIARAATPETEATLARYADRLARALATVINLIDPHVIVLGGGLSNVEALYDLVPGRWSAYVFSDTVVTPLLKSQHGDSSGVRGAAWLWPAAF